jgi:hypothetical protein
MRAARRMDAGRCVFFFGGGFVIRCGRKSCLRRASSPASRPARPWAAVGWCGAWACPRAAARPFYPAASGCQPFRDHQTIQLWSTWMNLDGLCFQVCATASIGVVSAQTRLHLTQRGSRIFGRYDGGSIVRGWGRARISLSRWVTGLSRRRRHPHRSGPPSGHPARSASHRPGACS